MQVQKPKQGYKLVENFFHKYIEIPIEWEYPKFSEIVNVNPLTKIVEEKIPYIPWITPKDMDTSEIYDSEDKITNTGLQNSASNLIEPNSILFVVRSGIIAKSVPIAITRLSVSINQDLKSLTPYDSFIPLFIFYSVLSHREHIRSTCFKRGTTVHSIDFPKLLSYKIPIPAKEEQQRITSILSNVDSQIKNQQEYKFNLENLKKGLMQKLLTGQIRVKV